MKCPKCHAQIDSDVCPYCGLDLVKQERDLSRFERFINQVLVFDRQRNVLGIVVFAIVVIASIVPVFTLPAAALGSVLLLLVHVLVKIIALGFVGWIAVSLISGWKSCKEIYSRGMLAEGTVIESKNMKEIHIGGKGYLPIVEFSAGGRPYRVVGAKSSERRFAAGEGREVIYLPEDPTRALLTEDGRRGSSLAIGVFLLAVIAVMAVFA